MSKEINEIYAGTQPVTSFDTAVSKIKRLEFQIFHLQTWINDEPEGSRRNVMIALLEGYNLRLSKMMDAINKASEEAHNASQALNNEQLDLFVKLSKAQEH